MKHPDWFALRCGDCARFRIENGKIKHRDGKPIPHRKTELVCDRVPCGRFDGPDGVKPVAGWRAGFVNKPRLRNDWWAVVQKYARCKLFGTLPKAGGINDQDELEMALFSAIGGVEKEMERDSKVSMIQAAGPLGMLFALGAK